MPKYRPARSKKFQYLSKSGFIDREAAELSGQYSMAQFRSLPYLITMIRSRRLYGTSLAAKGYGWEEIQRSIANLYRTKGWYDPSGKPSVWAMLRSFRRTAIADGAYIPPRRSHHSRKEITQAELNRQAKQLSIQRNIDKDIWGR